MTIKLTEETLPLEIFHESNILSSQNSNKILLSVKSSFYYGLFKLEADLEPLQDLERELLETVVKTCSLAIVLGLSLDVRKFQDPAW